MKEKIRRGIDMVDKYTWQTKFASLGLLLLTLVALVTMSATAASAAHPSNMGYPTSNTGVATCEGCHDGSGDSGTTAVCTDCHVAPVFSLSVTAAPTSVPALSPSDVTLTVGENNTVRDLGYNGLTPVFTPASGASVSLSGAGVSTSGTTDAAGIITNSVNPTGAGTIVVTATLPGFDSGTTSVTASQAATPVLTTITV
jgi:hypothetical protein